MGGAFAAFHVSSALKAVTGLLSQKLKFRKREETNRACEGESGGPQVSVVLDGAPQAGPLCLSPLGSGPEVIASLRGDPCRFLMRRAALP